MSAGVHDTVISLIKTSGIERMILKINNFR